MIHLSRKHKILLLGLLILITGFIVLANRNKPPQTTISDQETPLFSPFDSNLQPQQTFAELAKPQDTAFILLLPKMEQQEVIDFFNPLVVDNNLSSQPEQTTQDNNSFLIWSNNSGYLDVNQSTGQFELKFSLLEDLTTAPFVAEVDALKISQDWLLKYQLISEEDAFQVSYFRVAGFELDPVKTAQEAQIFQFAFFPKINNLTFFTPEAGSQPIVVEVTNHGTILRVNYQACPFLGKTKPEQKKASLKKLAQLKKEIEQQLPVISKIGDDLYSPVPLEQIKTVSYGQIELGYQIYQGQLLPVFQLSGSAQLDDGSMINVTAYLPALAE